MYGYCLLDCISVLYFIFISTEYVWLLYVIFPQSMYGYAVKHHVKKADMEVHNTARLTPLTLASKLGRNEIFKEIIELQSMVSVKFNPCLGRNIFLWNHYLTL